MIDKPCLFNGHPEDGEPMTASRDHWREVAEERNEELDRQAKRIEELEAEIERLQQIIAAYYDGWPEPWAECMDGFEMQEFAEKHGIMDRLERTVPCEQGCRCAEYYGDGDECECFVLRPEFRVKEALREDELDPISNDALYDNLDELTLKGVDDV